MKTAVVTGADRGLGLALAEQFAMNGYTVFAGKYLEDWTHLDDAAKNSGGRIRVVPLDVGRDASVREAARLIAEQTDSVDVLVNNAAVAGKLGRSGSILDELDFDDMLNTININAIGSLRVTHALMPHILRSGSKLVVNISSEAGSVGQSWRVNGFGYCMSKAAMNMHSTIVYNKIKDLGGHVLNLHPGWMKGWLGGSYNDAADLDPRESAAYLMAIIKRYRTYQTNQPAYLDYLGNRLKW
jgi:NAD(P)-dependent dehydrogenase (short-subunit alcohol dehydrogenase family)